MRQSTNMRQSMRLLICALAAAVLTLWLLLVPTANAQDQSPSPGPSDRTPNNIPDQKLDAAAAAIIQVATPRRIISSGSKQRPHPTGRHF